jgi:hypothetical protein
MATITTNTTITLPAGQMLVFGLGGSATAIIDGNVYELGLGEKFFGPFTQSESVQVVVRAGTITYNIETDGAASREITQDPITRQLTPDASDAVRGAVAVTSYSPGAALFQSRIDAKSARSLPSVPETVPTLQTTGVKRYIDPLHSSASDSNAGSSPSAPWANFSKLVGLNPGAGSVIYVANDAVFDYAETWANYTAGTPKFPYTSGDNLKGTAANPIYIVPFYPRGASSSKPRIRYYAQMQASDWTQETSISGGKVWSASWSKSYNNALATRVYFGADDTTGIAYGQQATLSSGGDTSKLSAAFHYTVSPTKVYVYVPDGTNPVAYYGAIKVTGGNTILGTAWAGMQYLRVYGLQFELCTAFNQDVGTDGAFAAQAGIDIGWCTFKKAAVGFFRNQQTNTTALELSTSVHDCYFEDVPDVCTRLGATGGNTSNTHSWLFYRNHINRANLNLSAGAPLYVQCKGGTNHHAWGNYGYDCRNGTGNCNIDGSMLYADVSTNKAVFYGNVAERCGVAFQSNSALGVQIVGNLAVDCWKLAQVTGTGSDNTPNMVTNVIHNTYLWTGRIQFADLPKGAGINASAAVISQWNDQKNSNGNMFANFSALNNLMVNASGSDVVRPALYYVSTGITTLTLGGNAAAGFGSTGVVMDNTTDTTMTSNALASLGSAADGAKWMTRGPDGCAKPAPGAPIVGAGAVLSSTYQDITGTSYATTPTVGCMEVLA